MENRHRIAVDLTPLSDQSGIGGAGALAVELIRNFAAEDSKFEFVLITCEDSHDELAVLDAGNIQRVCVKGAKVETQAVKVRQAAHLLVNTVLPESIARLVKQLYRKASSGENSSSLLTELGVDLLFCPFTGPIYHTPGIPTISVVHDLQFLAYPEYFSKTNLLYLREHFREACDLSAKIISGSNYAKQSILEHSRLRAEEITVIYDSAHSRLADVKVPTADTLSAFGLLENEFLFYPARYWPHKNHINALKGFKQFIVENPGNTKLVFSGVGQQGQDDLQRLVDELGLYEAVVILSWVEEEALAALYQYCWAVLFPSLYEGFGIPVIEAFLFEKPVLCSNVTSLPEVAGEAAIYFDPKSSEEIARAIVELASSPEVAAGLVEKGRAQLARFPDSRGMAARYQTVFAEVLGDC
jgi:glycosyltransferase involved in cell wall biosynthesis